MYHVPVHSLSERVSSDIQMCIRDRHAEIRVGDSIVEMGEAQGKYQRMPAMFYLYVPDCDAAYKLSLIHI